MVITLIFKTKTPYFEKERDNLKCNTVRKISEDDIRFENCLKIIQTNEPFRIKIINPNNGMAFERDGTDVTYYYERFIISWKPEEDL